MAIKSYWEPSPILADDAHPAVLEHRPFTNVAGSATLVDMKAGYLVKLALNGIHVLGLLTGDAVTEAYGVIALDPELNPDGTLYGSQSVTIFIHACLSWDRVRIAQAPNAVASEAQKAYLRLIGIFLRRTVSSGLYAP